MTDTSSLRAFLEARLAEDERGALIGGIEPDPWRAITDADAGPCVRTGTDDDPEWQREVNYAMWHCDDEADGCPEIARQWIAEAEHIARHDPVRVLREVSAKRAILAEHTTGDTAEFEGRASTIAYCPICSDSDCLTLCALASVWSDHPDYRQEWGS